MDDVRCSKRPQRKERTVLDTTFSQETAADDFDQETASADKKPRPEPGNAKKTASARATGAHTKPAKAKPGKKATRHASPPKARKLVKKQGGEAREPREGTKQAEVLAMMRKKGGASLPAIMKATGWQKHTVRGFMAGTVGKKMGLKVTSEKNAKGERVYSLQSK
jgi:uncharacterized protein DUF3489